MTNISNIYIDSIIDKYLYDINHTTMLPMLQYCIEGGGKRIRPSILLHTADSLFGIDSNIERLAVALECIHSYSLVHDDLPCMDNDDVRRGKPSCHMRYGYANAILIGDCLLNNATEVLFGGDSSSQYTNSCAMMMNCARQMIEGQMLDIAGSVTTYEQYQSIALTKTGGLLRASLLCPLIYYKDMIPQYDNIFTVFSTVSTSLALMYQIADDLSEIEHNECSILNIFNIKEARQLLMQLYSSAQDAIASIEASVDMKYVEDVLKMLISQ